MKPVNNFLQKRLDRLIETYAIYNSLCNYTLEQALSLDTFKANIKFQKQYISEHITSEINNISKVHTSYDTDNMSLIVQYDKDRVLVLNLFDFTIKPFIKPLSSCLENI